MKKNDNLVPKIKAKKLLCGHWTYLDSGYVLMKLHRIKGKYFETFVEDENSLIIFPFCYKLGHVHLYDIFVRYFGMISR